MALKVRKTDPPAPPGWEIGAICNLCDEAVIRFVMIEFRDQIALICQECIYEIGMGLIEKYNLQDFPIRSQA